MSAPGERRPPRLRLDAIVPEEDKPWRVRTLDGRVRGPVGITGLHSLMELGLVDASTPITFAEEEDWQRISEHPVWKKLRPSAPEFTFRNADLVPDHPSDAPTPATAAITPERAPQSELARLREQKKTERLLLFSQCARGARAMREVFVFLLFVTAADLAVSFVATGLEIVKWGILLSIAVVALAYYTYRALMH